MYDMSINRIEFQAGVSMSEFLKRYGAEAQGAAAFDQEH